MLLRRELKVLDTAVKRLKATNERQNDRAGILHQVAQFPIDQVYLIYKVPISLSALSVKGY